MWNLGIMELHYIINLKVFYNGNNIMNEIMISITFKDNKTPISFDLTKNTVFYGNNGRGKTRVLKTIELLYGLAKTLDYDSLISQLNNLNLSNLKINNNEHSTLFSKYNDSISNDKERLNAFLNKHKDIFLMISRHLSLTLNSNIAHPFMYNERLIKMLLNKLNHISLSVSSINELQDLIVSIERIIIEEIKFDERFKDRFSHEIEARSYPIKLLDMTRYLKQQINRMRFIITKKDSDVREELEKEKEKVLSSLGRKGARYLTVDSNFESEKIFKEISSHFIKLNEQYVSYLWREDINLSDIKDKILKYKERFYKFNSLMSKYNNNIEVEYNHLGNISFTKDKSKVDFLNLSSGEKRLIIIFLNLIFSEEDIILIDEPEISLSIDYQNKVIGHIMDIALEERKKIMIATHAPYIYKDFTSYSENNKVKV